MPSTTQQRTLKAAVILFSVVNFALTVSAGPLGDAAMSTSRYYWILMLISLVLLAAILILEKKKTPIDIVGLTYDKNSHKLELTVKNNDNHSYCIKSALRLVQPALNVIQDPSSEDGIPMATGQADTTSRKAFDLLGEDNDAIMIQPNEERILKYDVILPQEHIDLESNNNVEVHLSYGEDPRHMKRDLDEKEHVEIIDDSDEPSSMIEPEEPSSSSMPEPEGPSEIPGVGQEPSSEDNPLPDPDLDISSVEQSPIDDKQVMQDPITDNPSKQDPSTIPQESDMSIENEVVPEFYLIKDLMDAVKNSPDESVEFHIKNGNAIARWVRETAKDDKLAGQIEEIGDKPPEQLKKELVKILRKKVEAKKHPFLRTVHSNDGFKIKLGDQDMIEEVFLLEDLCDAIKRSPVESIEFHTQGKNDFSNWIRAAIGDKLLADALEDIQGSSQIIKQQMTETIDKRISQLRKEQI